MIQELHFDHVHRSSSPNSSHLDTQSLASTTSTTLYHAESVEDDDTHMGLKCKLSKLSCPTQIQTANPLQSPSNHSVPRSIVSSRTILILARAGSSTSQVKTAPPFSTPWNTLPTPLRSPLSKTWSKPACAVSLTRISSAGLSVTAISRAFSSSETRVSRTSSRLSLSVFCLFSATRQDGGGSSSFRSSSLASISVSRLTKVFASLSTQTIAELCAHGSNSARMSPLPASMAALKKKLISLLTTCSA